MLVRTEGASEQRSPNQQTNYPWYMGIPLQGIKTASSGLPDIQTNRMLSFYEKSYPQISAPSSTNFIFSKIFGEGKKQFV